MPLGDDARALLGSRILHARRAAGLTGGQLAAKLPPARRGVVDRSTVSQWERGHRVPTVDRLADIAAALGTTPSALLDGVTASFCDKV
jgi:transcriptional regulator with XRE-family HTH domain